MNVEEFEAMQGPASSSTPAGEKPKRKYTRRKKQSNGQSNDQINGWGKTSTKSNTVKLTEDQLTRMWAIMTGGAIIIDDDDGTLCFYVSMESFQQVLPALLEKL